MCTTSSAYELCVLKLHFIYVNISAIKFPDTFTIHQILEYHDNYMFLNFNYTVLEYSVFWEMMCDPSLCNPSPVANAGIAKTEMDKQTISKASSIISFSLSTVTPSFGFAWSSCDDKLRLSMSICSCCCCRSSFFIYKHTWIPIHACICNKTNRNVW